MDTAISLSASDVASSVWAKSSPYKSLKQHMIETGCCAQVLMNRGPAQPFLHALRHLTGLSDDKNLHLVGYIAALHDIGKCHPFFQKTAVDLPQIQKLKDAGCFASSGVPCRFRHELATEEILSRIWGERRFFPRRTRRTITRVLAMHHQGKHGEYCDIERKAQLWQDAQNLLELEMRQTFQPPELTDVTDFGHSDAFALNLMGTVILSDWIASGEVCENSAAEKTSLKDIQQTAERTIQSCGLISGKLLPAYDDFCALWPEIPPQGIRPLQKECTCMNYQDLSLCLLEAPMGEGKTEAALHIVSHLMEKCGKNGFYVALPTSATSNQMHHRIDALFQEHGLPPSRLLHSMAWLVDAAAQLNVSLEDDEDRQILSQWLMPLRRGLLSQYAVGTVDQAMMSVMQIKYGVLRLLGLADKILVIDEIHSYDAYMNQIIRQLISWCHALSIPMVLLSATLPRAKKRELLAAAGATDTASSQDYPLITAVSYDGTVTERPVCAFTKRQYHFALRQIMNDRQAIAELAVDKIKNGGCLCLLMDTVRSVQTLYPVIKGKITPDTDLIVFHARFTAERRQQIESECIAKFGKNAGSHRPQKAILLCTQVVEQSLDVDFDFMMTEIAPIDLLLQRAGRVLRHESTPRPRDCSQAEIDVFVPADHNFAAIENIYYPILLERTEKYLASHTKIAVPEEMRQCIEEVYSEQVRSGELQKYSEKIFSEQVQEAQAHGVILPFPQDDRFFACGKDASSFFVFQDKEDVDFQALKTRLTFDSRRVALLKPGLFSQARDNPGHAEVARQVLMQTVNLRLHGSAESQGITTDQENAFEGEKLLKGCLIVKLEENNIAKLNNFKITKDDIIGVIIEGA